jgi:hypothetical protein
MQTARTVLDMTVEDLNEAEKALAEVTAMLAQERSDRRDVEEYASRLQSSLEVVAEILAVEWHEEPKIVLDRILAAIGGKKKSEE